MSRLVERNFRAMGTDARIVALDADPGVLEAAEARVRWYERRWSRFVPTSELCRLNEAAGRPVHLPPDTVALVALAVEHWHETSGLFDPTVLAALEAAGYDRTFDEIGVAEVVGAEAGPAPTPAGLRIDRGLGSVTLPPGVRLDLGGIAKGHAADLVAQWLLDSGAPGALVSIGGDLRAAGEPPEGWAWSIEIDDPRGGPALGVVHVVDGAVATSSRVKRRWTTAAGTTAHHLVDPKTGACAVSDVLAATVVAATATDAEVLAKVALLAGSRDGARLVRSSGATGLLVTEEGVQRLSGLAAFEHPGRRRRPSVHQGRAHDASPAPPPASVAGARP